MRNINIIIIIIIIIIINESLYVLLLTIFLCCADTVVFEKLLLVNSCASIVNNIAVISCQAFLGSIWLICSSKKLTSFSNRTKRSSCILGLGGVTYTF